MFWNKKEENPVENPIAQNEERGFLASLGSFFLEVLKLAILSGITIGMVRYFLFKPFYVRGQSMEPNFYERDYLIIDEISYRFREPKRGEVVVFKSPLGNGDYYLKRVIGLPNERVKIEDNEIVIYNDQFPQGKVVEEVYLDGEDTSGATMTSLGQNEYFVLGDNRDASYDSRRFGPINAKVITGRAWFRGWPPTRLGVYENPKFEY